jgi:hypothetical protein
MIATCTKDPAHQEFITTAVEYHSWKVDPQGNFLADLECTDSTRPRSDNEWTCAICHAPAAVKP